MNNETYSFKPFELYNESDSEKGVSDASKRRKAVEAALELVRVAKMSGSSSNTLSEELKCLDECANLIQEALKVK